MAFTGMTEQQYEATRHKKGVSNDQVYVLTAMGRTNKVCGKPASYGKMRVEYLKAINGDISSKCTLITDDEPTYMTLNIAKHKRLEHGLSKGKGYNDQLHALMKTMINRTFCGVATKYLDNYVNYTEFLKMGKLIFDNQLWCYDPCCSEK